MKVLGHWGMQRFFAIKRIRSLRKQAGVASTEASVFAALLLLVVATPLYNLSDSVVWNAFIPVACSNSAHYSQLSSYNQSSLGPNGSSTIADDCDPTENSSWIAYYFNRTSNYKPGPGAPSGGSPSPEGPAGPVVLFSPEAQALNSPAPLFW